MVRLSYKRKKTKNKKKKKVKAEYLRNNVSRLDRGRRRK